MKQSTKIIIAVIVLIVIIVIAAVLFFDRKVDAMLGLNFGELVATTTPSTMGSTTPGRFGGKRGSIATGSIEVLNDNGFTLSLADGSTKNVILSATTTIQDYATASSTPTTVTSDQLSVGEQVLVVGAPDADGSSIDARDVRTGTFPTMMQMGGGPRSGTGRKGGGNGGFAQPD